MSPSTLHQDSGIVVVPIQSLKSHPSTSRLGSLYYAQLAALHAIDAYEYLNSPLSPSPFVDYSSLLEVNTHALEVYDFTSLSLSPYHFDDPPPPLLPCYNGSDDSDDSDIDVHEELPIRVWSR